MQKTEKVRGVGAAVAALVSTMVACSENDGGGAPTGAPTAPSPTVEAETCEPLPENAAVEFQPCGGEPFGAWRSISIEDAGAPLQLYRASGSTIEAVGSCPTARTTFLGDPSLFLLLEDGGGAAVRMTDLSISFDIDAACVRDVLQGDCQDIDCEPVDACTCRCEASQSVQTDDFGWTRHGTTLTLSEAVLGGSRASYEYCVEGDTMILFNGLLRITLERVKLSGPPTECRERPLDDCYGAGCHRGTCTGPAGCTGDTEGSCTNSAGCSWNPDVCGGTASGECDLWDYGVVHGCEILDATAICANVMETACSEQLLSLCDREPGCQRRSRCVGGAADCARWSGNCAGCERTEGCSCASDTLTCAGSAWCEGQSEQAACEALSECTWVTTCEPMSGSCAGVPMVRCNATSGCRALSAEDLPCEHMDCGSDRGTDCGTCSGLMYCSTANRCEPACTHFECGADHGVDCGTCPEQTQCVYHHCE